jgi:pimeloyl-ACP methyl ester carboxylesterase
VLGPLSRVTRVIAYDRAGYGGSDALRTVTVDHALQDLQAVLVDAAATTPLVLVGHSWGGVLARLYAARNPDDVAGLVLLDATHESLASAQSGLLRAVNIAATRVMSLHARSGLQRRSLHKGSGQLGPLVAELPTDRRARAIAELSSPARWTQAARELRTVPAVLAQVTAARVPQVPVVAVVGSKSTRPREAQQREELRSVYQSWLSTLPDGRLVEAPNSGHGVPLDDPQLVVDVVRELVEAARR